VRVIALLACLGLGWFAGLASAYFWPSLLPPEPVPARISQAEEAVKARIRDPFSAHFRGLKEYKTADNSYVCGFLNARNGMGGYTGWSGFIHMMPQNIVQFEPQDDRIKQGDFRVDWSEKCVSRAAENPVPNLQK